MATMKDIANRVGVSLTTVSNVVHGNYERVSPQTVQKILDAIQEELQQKGFLAKLQDYEPVDFWGDQE